MGDHCELAVAASMSPVFDNVAVLTEKAMLYRMRKVLNATIRAGAREGVRYAVSREQLRFHCKNSEAIWAKLESARVTCLNSSSQLKFGRWRSPATAQAW